MTQCGHIQGQRAVFFDVDGTLVPERSFGSFLAERLGHLVELDVAEAAYAAGTTVWSSMRTMMIAFASAMNASTTRPRRSVHTWRLPNPRLCQGLCLPHVPTRRTYLRDLLVQVFEQRLVTLAARAQADEAPNA